MRTRTAAKSSQREGSSQRVNSAAGQHGVALTPPVYGVDIVDRAAAGGGPLQCEAPVKWGAVSAAGLVIQPKLALGEPNDRYEHEADRVAQQVVHRIQSPGLSQTRQGGEVQRQVDEDEALQRKPEPLLLGEPAPGGMAASENLEAAIRHERGGGQPLPDALRTPMSQAFGADFRGVRIHANALSDRLSRSLSAKAFTIGHDVFFRQGAYEPASHTGQELIAHELTHVVQQTEVGRREKPGPRDQTEPRRVSVTNKQSEDCVQRMFGMEFEMQIPFCQKGPSGSLQEVTQGKKAKVQHATRRFRNEGDKTSGESGFKKEHGGLKVRSIAGLVTNPIDENRLDDEGEVAEYFSPLVRTGERLAAIADSGEAGAAVPLKELPGFELTGQDYVFSPQHAGCKMINTAYVQATFGVNFRGMSGLVEELAQHHLDLGGMVAAQVGELYRESVIREADVFIRLLKPESFLSVDSRVDDLVDSRDYDYASVAGYLTYIATLINAGKNEVVSKDNAKNAVRLLNKAEIHAPQLGKAEVRQALRDLVLAHTKTNESTLLWREEAKSAIGVQKTVKDILDQMIPLKGDPSLEEGLLGEDWHKREADEGQGQPLHRDAILEARRVYGAVGVGLRLAPAQWVPALTQYWRLLKEANRS